MGFRIPSFFYVQAVYQLHYNFEEIVMHFLNARSPVRDQVLPIAEHRYISWNRLTDRGPMPERGGQSLGEQPLHLAEKDPEAGTPAPGIEIVGLMHWYGEKTGDSAKPCVSVGSGRGLAGVPQRRMTVKGRVAQTERLRLRMGVGR
ncbi:MAG: hypothetical protein D6690_00425 [Nitrospirae bacterium]|nr:MAG: hypothetical protein D6690_00425 [Nitrospirota bacterium]